MKVRQGFVSNSSSASFLVVVRGFSFNPKEDDKLRLTKEQVAFLHASGFLPTDEITALRIFYKGMSRSEDGWVSPWHRSAEDRPYGYSLGLYTSIDNEDWAYQLTKMGIPFTSMQDYGRETWVYAGGDNPVMVFYNFGEDVEMDVHGDRKEEFLKRYSKKKNRTKKVVRVIPKDEYLARPEYQEEIDG